MAPDWFRSDGWTPRDRDDFETRLKRARATSRPQYLRIKALAIEEEAPESAEDLLRRVVAEYPENWPEVAYAHERLGDLRLRALDVMKAEFHYRMALETSPTLSGTTGEVHLKLGELLLDRDGPTDEVNGLLEASKSLIGLNQSVFRWHVLRARAAAAGGDHATAASSAKLALDLLDVPPQFSRHSTVGLAKASEELISMLPGLATATGERHGRRLWRRRT